MVWHQLHPAMIMVAPIQMPTIPFQDCNTMHPKNTANNTTYTISYVRRKESTIKFVTTMIGMPKEVLVKPNIVGNALYHS